MASTFTTPNGSAALLAQARAARGITLEDMARALDLEPAGVVSLERDGISGRMDIDSLADVGNAYGIGLRTIIEAAQRQA